MALLAYVSINGGGGHRFVGDLVAKWPHLFVIKFVYWWWNVCILCITCS